MVIRFVFYNMLLMFSVFTFAETIELSACKLDEDYAPHSFPDREAPGERLVQMAAAANGAHVTFYPSPWPRCLEGIKSGTFDLIHGPSPDSKFFSYINYPFDNGVPDPARSLGSVDYMLFKRKDRQISFDGETFTGLTSPVFYGDKAVIVRTQLDKLSVSSDDSALKMPQLLEMLYYDRTDVIVMRKYEGLEQINSERYRGQFDMLSVPIVSFNAFLGASFAFSEQQPDLLNAIWQSMADIRQSDQWPAILSELLPSFE